MDKGIEEWIKNLGQDLARVKSKTRIQTHGEALKLQGQGVITSHGQPGSVAYMEKVVVQALQQHLLAHCIRRTNSSQTWEGKLLNQELPPCTVLHALVEVTEEESRAPDADLADSVQAKIFDTKTHGKFFNDARQRLSFFPGEQTPHPYSRKMFLADRCSKLKNFVEFCRVLLTQGPVKVVPQEHHHTKDHIVNVSELGVPDISQNYIANTIEPTKIIANEKIVVYTMYAKYHLYMVEALAIIGIKALSISSAIPMAQRTSYINQFKSDPTIKVLIMSNVGMQGLNLTIARTLVLFVGIPSLIIDILLNKALTYFPGA
ncbi:hypothetical protein BDP27DRAFT_637477 [Rhodocollybia butyracea]|uniref:Helicase C-terminal domain-containing protein n=1 Tax=Rhodocollybia butyracea TaxID=206335 RepID=A0A9P5U8N3_9AGAR|nr:hypothetical protein BDP27DRAFT_637477 [Rhodocollybia butyracea]